VTTLRDKLIARLAKLGVEHRPLPGRDDGFASLCYGGKPFAHFHNDNELDIRLTKAIIEREGLQHPPGSKIHPDRTRKSHWIEVRFTKPADLDRLTGLVKLVIEQM
jgi:Family of unknown function (DUF5519)